MLSRTDEYALRAMAHIAALPDGAAIAAADLAEASGVPLAYLSKILRRLVLAGLLASEKGHHGGFRLARPAARIRFSDIMAATEMGSEPVECAFGWGACDASRPCPLHPSWSQLKGAYRKWAEGTTLEAVRDGTRSAPARTHGPRARRGRTR